MQKMSGNILRSTAVLTLVTNPNLVQGDPFEIATRNSLVSLGVIASATGAFVSITVGSRLVAAEFPPYVAATTYPVIPDQMQFTFIQMAGERLVISARNPTGGTITFGTLAQIADA
jgi:hypothetical protein